jgi:hypothetical protein
MNYLITIGVSILTLVASAFGVYNYVPVGWLGVSEPTFGTTIVTLNSSDKLSAFPAAFNAATAAKINGDTILDI